ncbi:hypothetical protein KHU50_001496 [Colletotrichum sp. SAR 10_65]|nr:hypothetical protein K4K51_012023 [Colletotrichum sp. SAR 10_75]KAI8205613.1 hypothetical protein KHU50_001496 [Colletotrichum sp. SAR 10_65]
MAGATRNDVSDDIESPQENAPLLHARDESSEPQAKDVWPEVNLLLKQCPPLVVTYLLQFFPSVLATLIAGRLSADDLAAASIGATNIAIFGSAFVSGMATALDTLCAQSYGSGDLHTVGLHVQKMVLLMELTCLPIIAFWIASPFLLSFVVKQPHLALKAGTFLRMSAIGLPAQALFEAARRFLQVQGDFHTAMLMIALCTPVNALLSWTLALPLGMGLDGAALGSSASQILRAAALLLYIASARGSWSHRCWGGFSRDGLRGWGLMVRLSFAGSVATLSEYAAFEILCFSTSYLSTRHLAAQSILTTATIFVWHVPFSISVFSSNRFQTRQPQEIPTPVPPPFLPGNPPPIALPTTWPRFEIFARPIPLQNGFYELVYVQVPEMIVLGITPIESGDRLRPAFVKAWERSNEIMRGRYGDRLPIWMRPKSRWQRILEMVPYGAKTEVMINLIALAIIGLAIVGIFVVWEARNLSGIQTCKKFC